jgi:hypothetical protein
VARITALRAREQRLDRVACAAAVFVPGAAGLLSRRPLRSLLSTLFFAGAVCAVIWRGGVVPDPLVAGAAAPAAFLGVACLSLIAYAAVVGLSIATRRST